MFNGTVTLDRKLFVVLVAAVVAVLVVGAFLLGRTTNDTPLPQVAATPTVNAQEPATVSAQEPATISAQEPATISAQEQAPDPTATPLPPTGSLTSYGDCLAETEVLIQVLTAGRYNREEDGSSYEMWDDIRDHYLSYVGQACVHLRPSPPMTSEHLCIPRMLEHYYREYVPRGDHAPIAGLFALTVCQPTIYE